MKTATTKKAAERKLVATEVKNFTALKSLFDEVDSSCGELCLLIEEKDLHVEQSIRRLDDLEKSKATAQKLNREAFDNAETAAAEEAQAAVRSASLAAEVVKEEVQRDVDSTIDMRKKVDSLRLKSQNIPSQLFEIEKSVRDLGMKARQLQPTLRGMMQKLKKVEDLGRTAID